MDRSILLHYPSGFYSPCRRAQPWVLLIPRLMQRATWWMPFDLQLRGSGQPGVDSVLSFLPADLLNGTLTGSPTDASLGRAHPPSYESHLKDIGGGGSVGFLCTLTFQCGYSAICLHFLSNSNVASILKPLHGYQLLLRISAESLFFLKLTLQTTLIHPSGAQGVA